MFRIVTGAVITIMGLFLLVCGIVEQNVSAIFGIVVIAIGVAILLNKQEDEIEEIKNDKNINHE